MVGHFRPFNSHLRRLAGAATTLSCKAAREREPRANIPHQGKGEKFDPVMKKLPLFPQINPSEFFYTF